MSEDEKFLRNAAHEFEEGFNSRDVDRIMRFYGNRYVDVNLTNPIQTKVERRAYYSEVMSRPGISLKVQPDEVLIRGDMAIVRGRILLNQAADGRPTSSELRYLEIWERDKNRDWKAIWGMDGPVQEYAP
jgi:ketosteroid isomerase-like protein